MMTVSLSTRSYALEHVLSLLQETQVPRRSFRHRVDFNAAADAEQPFAIACQPERVWRRGIVERQRWQVSSRSVHVVEHDQAQEYGQAKRVVDDDRTVRATRAQHGVVRSTIEVRKCPAVVVTCEMMIIVPRMLAWNVDNRR